MALEEILAIRAVREFSNRPVEDGVIRQIVNAGPRAQSSKNTQAWQFIVVRRKETLAELAQCGTYAGHLAGANFAVALVSPVDNHYDLGQATAYMQLAAWELKVGSCIATIYEPERAKAALGIPADHHLRWAILRLSRPRAGDDDEARRTAVPRRGRAVGALVSAG